MIIKLLTAISLTASGVLFLGGVLVAYRRWNEDEKEDED